MVLNNFTYVIYVILSQGFALNRKVSAFYTYLTQILRQRFKTDLKITAKAA